MRQTERDREPYTQNWRYKQRGRKRDREIAERDERKNVERLKLEKIKERWSEGEIKNQNNMSNVMCGSLCQNCHTFSDPLPPLERDVLYGRPLKHL